MIRNISAHSDRLFCYRNKYYISFKNIDKNYKRKESLHSVDINDILRIMGFNV